MAGMRRAIGLDLAAGMLVALTRCVATAPGADGDSDGEVVVDFDAAVTGAVM